MTEVEARPFLRISGSNSEPDGAHSSRHRVLVVGDKRARIYSRYRSSKRGRQPRENRGFYRGPPSAETAQVEAREVFNDPSERVALKELSEDTPQAAGKMCQAIDDDSSELKPEQTKWKLVDKLLAV